MKRQTKSAVSPGRDYSPSRSPIPSTSRLKETSRGKNPAVATETWTPKWLLGILLVALTIIAYQPAMHGGMLWDDDQHITRPELRSLHGLARIWTEPGATAQYYPLVHCVFWAEHRVWGDATSGYHWGNVLLHAFSALLLVGILRQLQIPGAWLAGALFALHPVEVESVAWISELKNTLSGGFYMGAVLAYLNFDRNRSRAAYTTAFGLFLLGLLSKTVIATLPAALLVIFWWQRARLYWRRDVLPLMPFFVIGAGMGLFTAWVERNYIGAHGAEFHFSIIQRCLIAGRDIWFYLGKLFWPVNLAFIYPRWDVNQNEWWQYLFPAAVLILIGLLIWRRWRGSLAALLFFIVTLFPALGFFNVYPFRYSLVADHFQYLASIGPLTLVASAIAIATTHLRNKIPRFGSIVCVPLIFGLGILTWRQCVMYTDAETLWRTTLRHNPNSWMAHDNLGDLLAQQGRMPEASAEFQRAMEINPSDPAPHMRLGKSFLQSGRLTEARAQYQAASAIKPDFAEAHEELGGLFFQLGQFDESIAEYQKALELKPNLEQTRNNLGLAFARTGREGEAITQYQAALQLKPDDGDACYNLGLSLDKKGQISDAIAQFQKALQINPDNADARMELGLAFFQSGRINEAIAQFQKAIESKPDFAKARMNLGAVFLQQSRIDEAIAEFQKAVETKPDFVEAHEDLAMASLKKGNAAQAIAEFEKIVRLKPADPAPLNNLAWLLATVPDASVRNGPKALKLAEQANTLTGEKNPVILKTLAAACAELGRFDDARRDVRKAIELAQAAAQHDLVTELNVELQRYEAGLPLHQ